MVNTFGAIKFVFVYESLSHAISIAESDNETKKKLVIVKEQRIRSLNVNTYKMIRLQTVMPRYRQTHKTANTAPIIPKM